MCKRERERERERERSFHLVVICPTMKIENRDERITRYAVIKIDPNMDGWTDTFLRSSEQTCWLARSFIRSFGFS